MLSTRDFFARILAPQPNHVLTLGAARAGRKIFWNKNYADLDALTAAALEFDAEGTTVYHAIGSFSDNETTEEGRVKVTRRAEQTTVFKALACDIDVGEGKPYATQKDAAVALVAAIKACDLPPPMLVSSGYGLHCYWPLVAPVPRDSWMVASTALRDRLTAGNLQVDTSKVCDPSMVLRPVGTTNRKGDAEALVRCVRDCPNYEFSILQEKLGPPSAPVVHAVAKPVRRSALLDAVLTGEELPPADAAQLAVKCTQLGAVASSRGNVPEPLWYLALGIANFCEDSEAVAIRWSDGHPSFSEDETLKKLHQWKRNTTGPSTCSAFHKVAPDVCKGCPHYGKITSPVQLSVPKPDPVSEDEDSPMPWGYQISKGKVLRTVGGIAEAICEYPLIVRERRFDPQTGKALAVLEATMPVEGAKIIELPIDILAAGKDKWTAFMFNNSMAPGRTPKHLDGTRHYIMTYLEELQRRVAPTNTYSQFGWTKDNAFILGEWRYSAAGVEPIHLASSIGEDMRAALISKGELKNWTDAVALYGEPGMELPAMCLLIGMGTPLMAHTGLDGLMVSMYHSGSGTGKTTTGHLISSIWGHPSRVQIGKNDTTNALYNTLVQLNNLPAYFDEMTNVSGEDISDLTYNLAQGRERRRLTEQAKLRVAGMWKLILFGSSNRSAIEKLEANKLASEGELQRILEYHFVPNAVFNGTKDGKARGLYVARTIEHNYGLAGPIILEALCKIPDIQALIAKGTERFAEEFKFEFDAKERFKQTAHVIAYIAGALASRLGLIDFDYRRVIRASLANLRTTRENAVVNRADAIDIIGGFTSEHRHMSVYERVNSAHGGKLSHDIAGLRGELRARWEVTHNNGRIEPKSFYYVDRAYFNKWCQEKGVDASSIVSQLREQGAVVNNVRVSLGRRTGIVTAAVWCYEFDITHPMWASRLAGIAAENNMFALKEVEKPVAS